MRVRVFVTCVRVCMGVNVRVFLFVSLWFCEFMYLYDSVYVFKCLFFVFVCLCVLIFVCLCVYVCVCVVLCVFLCAVVRVRVLVLVYVSVHAFV